MKDTKKILCTFSFYDQVKIEEKLEEMAARGWMVEKAGKLTWTFRRSEPKKLRFCVTYFPAASEFDPAPTEGELTKLDFCAQDGWTLVLRWGVMQIFCSEDGNAVPIETEPLTQVENVSRAMRKNVLLPHLMEAALILWYIFLQYDMFRRDSVDYLSSPLRLYQLPLWLCLLLACLYEIGFYFCWTRKARKKAERDSVFLPIRTNIKASCVLLVFSFLFLFFSFGSSKGYMLFGLLWCGVMFLITRLADAIKKKLKEKGASRRVNFAVSIGSVIAFTLAFFALITALIIGGSISLGGNSKPVGSYEYGGRTWDIYDDPLPLEIEDLTDINAKWSKEGRHQETGLLAFGEYRQRPLYTEPHDVPSLEYSIIDVKAPLLCDYVRQAVLNARQDEVHGDYVFIDHYEPVDAAVWGAEEAYQLHWSDGVLDTYLVFWDSRIVEIKFYQTPSTDQIATAAEILHSA